MPSSSLLVALVNFVRAFAGADPDHHCYSPSPLIRGHAAKAKGQRTKSFLRVLKYSNGGVLEVGDMDFSASFLCFCGDDWMLMRSDDYLDACARHQPAKVYKIKHLSKVEVVQNDPSGCTFLLVLLILRHFFRLHTRCISNWFWFKRENPTLNCIEKKIT